MKFQRYRFYEKYTMREDKEYEKINANKTIKAFERNKEMKRKKKRTAWKRKRVTDNGSRDIFRSVLDFERIFFTMLFIFYDIKSIKY